GRLDRSENQHGVEDERLASGPERACPGAPHAPSPRYFPGRSAQSRARPAVHSADPAPRDRILLASSSGAGRPACARARGALQQRRCPVTGGRLLKTAEVDHRVPLFKVWRERADHAWPALLDFWGVPNLQVINRTAHVEKCAAEAGQRATTRASEIL